MMENINKRIVFVIKDIKNSAGTEKATIGIANGLSEKGFDVHIAILEKSGEPFFELSSSVKIFAVSIKGEKPQPMFKDWERRKKLRRFYLRLQPDLIVFVGSGRSLLNIPTARAFRYVTWEHFNSSINWHLLHPISKILAAKYCESIITLTEEDAEDYSRKYKAKTLCIPNLINVPDQRTATLDQKQVIAVGRLTKQKGFDLLINAWAKTKCREEGWRLKIVGNGKLFDPLKNQIQSLNLQDSIEIKAATPKVWDELIQSSVYIMTSRYEGLPLILLEALAAGLPILAFDCKTGPKEVIDPKENGYIVSNFNIEKMAQSIDELAFDEKLRKRFGKKSIDKTPLFSKETIIQKWMDLINADTK